MPSYYVKNAPKCKTENGKFVIEGDDDTDDEWIMEWSTVLPLLRNMQRLAAEFDAHSRKAVVPACGTCREFRHDTRSNSVNDASTSFNFRKVNDPPF